MRKAMRENGNHRAEFTKIGNNFDETSLRNHEFSLKCALVSYASSAAIRCTLQVLGLEGLLVDLRMDTSFFATSSERLDAHLDMRASPPAFAGPPPWTRAV